MKTTPDDRPEDPVAELDERAIALGERVTAFIRDARSDDFDELALRVFDYQFERNDPYRRFAERRGATPGGVSSWAEIPAVPAEAFKHARLACADGALVFRTSGTREGVDRRGEHLIPDPSIYEDSLTAAFRRFVVPDVERIRILSLVPRLKEEPHSSLSYMASVLLARFGDEASATLVADRRVLFGALFAALDRAAADGEALLLLGTTIVHSAVMDAAEEVGQRWRLAPGSRLVDTGGNKGLSRAFDDGTLLARYGDTFGLPAEACVNEYGMTEMLSQLYNTDLLRWAEAGGSGRRAGGIDRSRKMGPHWTRTRVVDPETLEDADEGLLVHLDLANVHTVSAILTEDVGVRTSDGWSLRGRRLGAEARGCAIAMDEWLR